MKQNLKRIKTGVLLGTAAAAGLLLWSVWGTVTPQVSEYILYDNDLPEAFSGFCIVQVSDLHNTEFGEGNSRLLSMMKDATPDIIVITGDLVDSRQTDLPAAVAFVKEAIRIAPTYYVAGNHESRLDYAQIRDTLIEAGVTVLDNETVVLDREGQSINLVGLLDSEFHNIPSVPDTLHARMQQLTGYTVVLHHHPELFDHYVLNGVNLAFAGHAHGGQFRIPFVGGIYAPEQGLFPKYDAGLYTAGNTTMVVSRGLGNSVIPLRINNRPELVVVRLNRDTDG